MRVRKREKAKNNVFVTGVPAKIEQVEGEVTDTKAIIKNVLEYVNPDITPDDYKLLKVFEPAELYSYVEIPHF